jgi:hypothetical protein
MTKNVQEGCPRPARHVLSTILDDNREFAQWTTVSVGVPLTIPIRKPERR